MGASFFYKPSNFTTLGILEPASTGKRSDQASAEDSIIILSDEHRGQQEKYGLSAYP